MISLVEAERGAAFRVPSKTVGMRLFGVLLGFVALVLSAVFMICLHIVASGQIDPVGATMSNYVFVGGAGWMFGASVAGVAVGGIGVLLSLSGTGLLRSGLLRLAICLASVCSLLAAVFPTNRTGPLTLAAEIHRYSAGVAFFCVPIAAVLVAFLLRGRGELPRHGVWLRRSAVLTSVILALFLTSHFGMMPEFMQQLRGLFQRALFLTQLVILAQLLLVPLGSAPVTSYASAGDGTLAAWHSRCTASIGLRPSPRSSGRITSRNHYAPHWVRGASTMPTCSLARAAAARPRARASWRGR